MSHQNREPVRYMQRTRRYYEAQGFEKPYVWAHNDDVPFVAPTRPVSESKLALITTASLEHRRQLGSTGVQSGSVTAAPQRLFADDLAWHRQATHLDDLNSYFPIDRLRELADAGRIGSLAARFHCAPTEYSQRRTVTQDAPEILERCREDGAEVALLVPI